MASIFVVLSQLFIALDIRECSSVLYEMFTSILKGFFIFLNLNALTEHKNQQIADFKLFGMSKLVSSSILFIFDSSSLSIFLIIERPSLNPSSSTPKIS